MDAFLSPLNYPVLYRMVGKDTKKEFLMFLKKKIIGYTCLTKLLPDEPESVFKV
jgi:hypothetical protein